MGHLLINIHGFLSWHQSPKVLALRDTIRHRFPSVDFVSPELPDRPSEAVAVVESLITQHADHYKTIGLIGHSIGAYFATYLAVRHQLKAVLVNPVVRGYEIMCEFYGPVHNPHTGRDFEIDETDIDYLVSIYLEALPEPSRFLLMQQLGDEIVDPTVAKEYYPDCPRIVEQGGNHDFVGLENHTDEIVHFLFGEARL